MRKIFLLFIFALCTIISAGCSSTTEDPYDSNQKYSISKTETNFLVNYVRKFLSKSKKLNLTEEEKTYIANNEPLIKASYKAPKEGNMEIAWELATRRIKAEADGLLTKPEKCQWQVALVKKESFMNASEAPPLPKEAELMRRMKEKEEKEKAGN